MARTILVLGQSGRGKSTSLRNLDPAHVAILNTERKKLPFKAANLFKMEVRPTTVKETLNTLDKMAKGTNCKIVVIDSFSAFTDTLLAEARIIKSGWDVWSYYNETLYKFFDAIKKINDSDKHCIVIGHEEILEGPDGGDRVVSLKVKGKEWSGVIEKEFDIVLHSFSKVLSPTEVQYKFRTQTDGVVPAKSPMGMFEDIVIDNDMEIVINSIEDYDA